MLKGVSLRMLKAKANGGDVEHQRSEKLQSAARLASNNAKMTPYFEGELGRLPKDTGGMVCE